MANRVSQAHQLGRMLMLAVVMTAGASAAQAQDERSAVAWACTQEYDSQFHARCVPTVRSSAELLEAPAAAAPDHRAAPIDPRPVSARGARVLLSYEVWRVPLHSLPSAPEFARELLHIVLCGRAQECVVTYDPAQMQARLPAGPRNPFIR